MAQIIDIAPKIQYPLIRKIKVKIIYLMMEKLNTERYACIK